MGNLRSLYLGNTKITGAPLSELRKLRKLTHIFLNGTEVDDSTIRVLATHPTLEFINVERTKVTAERVEELRSTRPELEIRLNFDINAPYSIAPN